MSKQSLNFFALLGLLFITAMAGAQSALAQNPFCAAEEVLPPGSVLKRQYAAPSAEPELVRVPLTEPGVLELYVSGGVQAAVPQLSFLGTGCDSPAGEDVSWAFVRETPRELHVLIHEPGDVYVAVSSEDPAVPLTDYALHATFAAESTTPEEVIELASDPPSDCQAQDLPTFSPEPFAGDRFVVLRRDDFTKDVDPWYDDGFSGLIASPGVLVVESPNAALDAALHDGDGCALEQRLAEGMLDGSGTSVSAPVHAGSKRLLLTPRTALDVHYDVYARHFALCTAATDDHPDRPLCATPLSVGAEVTGLVDDADDEDHLTFTLAGQTTVAVDLTGGSGVRGVLFDEDGQRLETWEAGRLVRTLGSGRFYVLVAGAEGWTGEYSLRLDDDVTPAL